MKTNVLISHQNREIFSVLFDTSSLGIRLSASIIDYNIYQQKRKKPFTISEYLFNSRKTKREMQIQSNSLHRSSLSVSDRLYRNKRKMNRKINANAKRWYLTSICVILSRFFYLDIPAVNVTYARFSPSFLFYICNTACNHWEQFWYWVKYDRK